MNCRKARLYLYAYCKQELPPDETKEVKAHLDSCFECTREMEEITETNLMCKNGLENFAPSPDFNEKLLAKIQGLSSPVEVRVRKSWWQELLHETFPSIRLRWVAVGAASVIVLVLAATMITQKQFSKEPGSLASNSANTDNKNLAISGSMRDTTLDEIFKGVETNAPRTNKSFVMDNLSTPAFNRVSDLTSRGEDGRIRPVDLRRRFILERSSYQDVKRGSSYVLPVVSTQPASKKTDY
jgi:hypothetical protein